MPYVCHCYQSLTIIKLEIQDCSNDNDFPPNASMHPVMSITDAISLMNRANAASTAINDRSSHSHR